MLSRGCGGLQSKKEKTYDNTVVNWGQIKCIELQQLCQLNLIQFAEQEH